MGLTLNSTSNHLWLEFNSNGSDTGQGFQLTYSSKQLAPATRSLSIFSVRPSMF